jgi:hypothetical protein
MVSIGFLLFCTAPLTRYSTDVLSETAMRIASLTLGYMPFEIHP